MRRPRREAFQNFKSAELDLPRSGLRISHENAPGKVKVSVVQTGGAGWRVDARAREIEIASTYVSSWAPPV